MGESVHWTFINSNQYSDVKNVLGSSAVRIYEGNSIILLFVMFDLYINLTLRLLQTSRLANGDQS